MVLCTHFRAVFFTVGLISCQASDGADTDSTAPPDVTAADWQLEVPALVEIGDESRGPNYQFAQISGLRRLQDGGIVVANNGTAEVRAYSPAGEHRWSAGQLGDGPGDFRFLTWIALLPGDTILAHDNQPTRLVTFTPEGQHLNTLPVRVTGVGCGPYRPGLPGLQLLVLSCPPRVPQPPGIHRPARHVAIVDPMTSTLRRLATVEGPEELVLEGGNWAYPALGLSPAVAARDSIIVYGSSERFEVQVMDLDGRVVRTISWQGSRQPVSDSLRRLYEYEATRRLVEFARRTGRDTLAVIEGGVRQAPAYSDSVPTIGSILLDPDLNIWVSDFGLRENPATRWSVFGLSGEHLAEVRVPQRFRIFDIGRDYVLGVRRDVDGLESIRLHRLVKSN